MIIVKVYKKSLEGFIAHIVRTVSKSFTFDVIAKSGYWASEGFSKSDAKILWYT